MTYTQKNLSQDEKILYQATLSRAIYINPVSMLMAGVAATYITIHVHSIEISMILVGPIVTVVALFAIAGAWWRRTFTDIVVTNKRLIYKTGFVRRQTLEMFVGRIETIFVKQSMLGRILNYGSVDAKGAGQTIDRMNFVDAPINLRNSIPIT